MSVAKIAELVEAGEDVVNLCQGNPDLSTPPHIVEALRREVLDPATHRSRSAASPSASRALNSHRIEQSNPASSSSRPSAYLNSILVRTASATARSDRFSANCSTLTSANCPGENPARPSDGYRSANSSSSNRTSSRSRRQHPTNITNGVTAGPKMPGP